MSVVLSLQVCGNLLYMQQEIFQPELVQHHFQHTLLVRRVMGSAQVIVSGNAQDVNTRKHGSPGPSLDINDHAVVWLPNCARLFTTPWNAARQTSLSSPSPRVCPSSCPLHQWYHPAISSSVVLFSIYLQSSQHQGLFQWVGCSHEVI